MNKGVFHFKSDPVGDCEILIRAHQPDPRVKFSNNCSGLDQSYLEPLPVGFSTQTFLEEMENLPYEDAYEHWILTAARSGHTQQSTAYIQIPANGLPIHEEVLNYFTHLTNIESRVLKMEPGGHIPPHVDVYNGYTNEYSDGDFPVVRYLVFLEDWVMGHYFLLGEKAITWAKGDYYEMANLPHASGCGGYIPKWTLRITGQLKS